jgi:hypothetical protein
MKRAAIFAIAVFFSTEARALPTAVITSTPGSKQIRIDVDFKPLTVITTAFTPNDFALKDTEGHELNALYVGTLPARPTILSLTFPINSETDGFLEGMVSDRTPIPMSNYVLTNNAGIDLSGPTSLQPRDLESISAKRIPDIAKTTWDDFVLDYYALDYMFPHKLVISTQVPVKNSSQELVVEIDQSGPYAPQSSFYWGVQSHWGSSASDSFNFIKAYPFVAQFATERIHLAAFTSAETGPAGFVRYGKATAGAMFNLIIPFVPLGFLRFGHDRLARYPQLSLTGTEGIAWSDTSITDKKQKYPFDFSAGLNYDFPILDRYYFESAWNLVGSSSLGLSLKNYSYQVALGYVEKGSFKVLLSYKQGLGEVSYQYDKQLLLGVAFDLLKASM